jgi:N-methylhydantoinase A
VFLSGDELTAEALAGVIGGLSEQAQRELGESQAQLSAVYELRYRGQAFELGVSGPLDADPERLRRDFETLHDERYGYHDAEQQLELVTVRVTATSGQSEVALGTPGGGEEDVGRGSRSARLDGREVELEVLRGSPPPGTEITGPAVVELPESTLLVGAGWAGRVDEHGTIELRA